MFFERNLKLFVKTYFFAHGFMLLLPVFYLTSPRTIRHIFAPSAHLQIKKLFVVLEAHNVLKPYYEFDNKTYVIARLIFFFASYINTGFRIIFIEWTTHRNLRPSPQYKFLRNEHYPHTINFWSAVLVLAQDVNPQFFPFLVADICQKQAKYKSAIHSIHNTQYTINEQTTIMWYTHWKCVRPKALQKKKNGVCVG